MKSIRKTVSYTTHNPHIIVITVPSMDGYASATSSMSLSGLKVSIPSAGANVIIGDIDCAWDLGIIEELTVKR